MLLVWTVALSGVVGFAAEYQGTSGELDVTIPQLVDAGVRIDGRLEEPAWQQAARLVEFTQYDPVEGVPPSEPTEVLVFYTPEAIYFGVRALDDEPHRVVARLVERDQSAFTDDWVRIMLDTFDDQRQAYAFYVNPLGIQTDGLWIEGLEADTSVPIDFNPDFIWYSNGRVTEDGWVVEIRIPYVSLRFRPSPVQSWGFNVAREVRRKGFKQSWAPLTKEISNTLAQEGRLVGLRDLRPRRLMEVNPFVTGKRIGASRDGVFEHEDFDPELGMNGRVGITQNLILDGTYNPDFSQVETDAFQISVNERFALFYPEKRPFFLEGTEVFQTPTRLVYTRRVLDPIGGLKLTGKVGSFNLGYLGSLDEGPVTLEEGENNALFNFFRLRRDIGAGSTFGVLLTDRTEVEGNAYNRVAAADLRLLFKERYTWTTQYADSWTADVGDGRARPLFTTTLERSGQRWGWLFKFEDIHPEFLADSGFIRRYGDTEIFGSSTLTFYGSPGAFLEQTSIEVRGDSYFDHDEFWDGGELYEGEFEIQPTFSFRGDRNLAMIIRDGYFRFRPEDYTGYEVAGEDGGVEAFQVPAALTHMLAGAFMPSVRVTNSVRVEGRVYFRELPIYSEGSLGFEFLLEPEVSLRPNPSLLIDASYLYSRIRRKRDESVFSVTHIPRLKLQYHFTKTLFARAIAQYNLGERDVLRDPSTGRPLVIDGRPSAPVDAGTFEGQFLLSYEPSPGTIFYVGYSFLKEGANTWDVSAMEPMADGLFVKLSYLFRM